MENNLLGYIERIEYIYHLTPEPAIGIWFRGCNHKCEGCINPHLWLVEDSVPKTVKEVLNDVLELAEANQDTKYIVFSGGEPLDQHVFFKYLSEQLKLFFPEFIQILFTGYEDYEVQNFYINDINNIGLCLAGRYKGSFNGILDKKIMEIDNFGSNSRLIKFYTELAQIEVVEVIMKNGQLVVTGFENVQEE